MFRVTTLPSQPSKVPAVKGAPDTIDYGADFFGREAFLTVSGQLGAETHACALGDVLERRG